MTQTTIHPSIPAHMAFPLHLCQRIYILERAGRFTVRWAGPVSSPGVDRQWRDAFDRCCSPVLERLLPGLLALHPDHAGMGWNLSPSGEITDAPEAIAAAVVRAIRETVPATVVIGPAVVSAWLS